MFEKRRHPRRPVKVEFLAHDELGVGQLSFTSGDLSAGGAFLSSELLLEKEERLTLVLPLPGRAAPLRAEARVVRVERFPKGGEPAGMGIEFSGMSEEDQRALREFLSAK